MAISCDPADLLAAARCLRCLNTRQHEAIRNYALAVVAGGSLDPVVLAGNATAFQGVDRRTQHRIKTLLLLDLSTMPPGSAVRITDDGTVRVDDDGNIRIVMP